VLACGAPDAVAQLRDWLRVGPDAARVTGIACETLPWQMFTGFSTG
jgi:acylphosphatase